MTISVAMMPLSVDGQQCRDWSTASELEWLETNGTGAFAMGTVAGANTRRYHALLVASLRPPVERNVLLSRVEEEIICEGDNCNLGAAQYPGSVTPSGFHWLQEFRLDPFPTWTYRTGCAQVEKKLFLLRDKQTVVLTYKVSSRCRFRVRPFLAFRDYHSLQHSNNSFSCEVNQSANTVSIQPFQSLPTLQIHHNGAGFVPVGHWYFKNEYRKEMDRGLDFQEDLYSPGWVDFELEAGQTAFLVATIEPGGAPSLSQVLQWENEERSRREQLIRATPEGPLNELRSRLEVAAEQFLVRRVDGCPTIIAGYPWFTDWGRDTMICLPGLLIGRGKHEDAQEILSGFLQHLDQGLIPNRFPDGGQKPEYNTADAALGTFQAAWALGSHSSSETFLRQMFYPGAKEIIDWHLKGTHFGIQVDPEDGLLSAGRPGTQLTWMDAKVGDWVVTPRHGKAVEINALWYNALRMMSSWAKQYGESAQAEHYSALADRVMNSFEEKFWNPARQCLFDRIGPEGPDDRLRPNQLFALSLPFPLLSEEKRLSVLKTVEEFLLTPFGLRTLEPGHPEYRARYHGSPIERDGAYHQGTVWPWLMGPYISASLQVRGRNRKNIDHCIGLVQNFAGELHRGCLGNIAELYDAEPPQNPTGAPAQAWSVAELLRVIAELG